MPEAKKPYVIPFIISVLALLTLIYDIFRTFSNYNILFTGTVIYEIVFIISPVIAMIYAAVFYILKRKRHVFHLIIPFAFLSLSFTLEKVFVSDMFLADKLMSAGPDPVSYFTVMWQNTHIISTIIIVATVLLCLLSFIYFSVYAVKGKFKTLPIIALSILIGFLFAQFVFDNIFDFSLKTLISDNSLSYIIFFLSLLAFMITHFDTNASASADKSLDKYNYEYIVNL